MPAPPRVLLITGPGGSGKSTLADRIALEPGWVAISEDDSWGARGWNGHRSPQQEQVVQAAVGADVLDQVGRGRSVALDFILYKAAPNPATAYQDLLDAHETSHRTVVLRPTLTELLRRMDVRGRASDLGDLDARRSNAEHQLQIADAVECDLLLDPTGRTVEQLRQECLSTFV